MHRCAVSLLAGLKRLFLFYLCFGLVEGACDVTGKFLSTNSLEMKVGNPLSSGLAHRTILYAFFSSSGVAVGTSDISQQYLD